MVAYLATYRTRPRMVAAADVSLTAHRSSAIRLLGMQDRTQMRDDPKRVNWLDSICPNLPNSYPTVAFEQAT